MLSPEKQVPETHRSRALVAAGVLVVFLACFTVLQAWMRQYDIPQFLLHAIFNLYALLIIILFFVIVRNAVKFFHERTSAEGGGLKRRLLIYFSTFTIPMTMLLALSLTEAVYHGVQRWFDPSMDALARDADQVLQRFQVGMVRGSITAGPEDRLLADRLARALVTYEREKSVRVPVRRNYLLILALVAFLVMFGSIWVVNYLARELTVPIRQLAAGARAIADGKLDFPLNVSARDEIAVLARAFAEMQRRLRETREHLELALAELKDRNRLLEQERAFVSTVLAEASAGVLAVDREDRIVTINKAMCRMLGGEVMSWLGKSLDAAFGREDLRYIAELMQEARTHHVPIRAEEIRLASGDEKLIVSASVSSLAAIGADDRFLGLVLVAEDVTQLLEAQKMSAWREVARRVAHEIKNPLTPIKLSAQRLCRWREAAGDAAVPPLFDECTETILAEVDGMQRLVDEFSRFARLPEARLRVADLNRIVRSLLSSYEELHKGVQFAPELASDLPLLDLDEGQMRQVLVNLIENAVHAMNGIGRIEVATSWDGDLGIAYLAVSDEGPGISPEVRKKLFLPSFTTKQEGSGLGLAIVSRIVAEHYGYIRVRSRRGNGTRFVVELPIPKRRGGALEGPAVAAGPGTA